MKRLAIIFTTTTLFVCSGVLVFAAVAKIDPGIPGPNAPSSPIAIIANVYNFAMIAGGVIAFGAIVWGAIEHITGQGNVVKIGDANDRITQAVLGILLLAGAYIILNIVNPRLTKLEIPQLPALPPSADVSPYGKCGDVVNGKSQPGLCALLTDECKNNSTDPDNPLYVCNKRAPEAWYACYDNDTMVDGTCGAKSETQDEAKTRCENMSYQFRESGEACNPNQCASGGCVSISSVVAMCTSGCEADAKMKNVLTCLSGAGISLRITEAMPPSVQHSDSRHQNGCAVDATLVPPVTESQDCSRVCDLQSAVATCGGGSLNEYFRACGTSATCKGTNTEKSTGDHVHITANACR